MTNVLEYLENAAEQYSDEIKIVSGEQKCTYRQLCDQAKAAGSFLLKYNLKGRPAAVYMEKGIPALAALFGIVYAGGFYVFINTWNPENRIRKILDVCEDCVVITDRDHVEKAAAFGSENELLLIEDLSSGAIDEAGLDAVRKASSPADPLYSIFTSGSTGVPKGVLISHECVLDFMNYFPDTFGIADTDVIGNQAPFDFDVSVKDIYGAMKTGAKLVIIPTPAFALPNAALDILCEEHVTVLIWAVSALCQISMMKGFDYKVPEDIRLVMFSGEAMPLVQLAIWQRHLPEAEFVNLYGPTEITCNSTYYRISRSAEELDVLPIGKPFPGRKVFLLGEADLEISEQNITGELCTGGQSLAIGYYRDPETTGRAFTSDPRDGHQAERIYRTGDLAYYNKDGDLVFAGRKDFQIKHMGHRIELEEIERTLEKIPGVGRIVCVYDNEKKRIHAFYIGERDKREIRIEAAGFLPAYMIPTKWKQLENIPVTRNGKADRAALAEMISEKRK